jgi:hypothetical protein
MIGLACEPPHQRDTVKLQAVISLLVCHIEDMHRTCTALMLEAQADSPNRHFLAIATPKFDWLAWLIPTPKNRHYLHDFIKI